MRRRLEKRQVGRVAPPATVGTDLAVARLIPQEDGNLLYRFTLEDSATWTAPWTGEYVWRADPEKVYEYACHEGNYSFGNIMRGARILEQDLENPSARR